MKNILKLSGREYAKISEFLHDVLTMYIDDKESVPYLVLCILMQEKSSNKFLRNIENFETLYVKTIDTTDEWEDYYPDYEDMPRLINIKESKDFFKELFNIMNGIRFLHCYLNGSDELINVLEKISKELKIKFNY